MKKNTPIFKKLSLDNALPAIAIVGFCIVLFLFYYFGFEIVFVLAPIAIGGTLGYRMHVRRLAEKTREISEASRVHLATVEALATAIDARDQVGMGHVRRAQIYAVGLGRLLKLGETEINALRTGALLHDIGKLAVPDHILNKPSGLTPAEMEKTKIHSSVGASILEKVGFDYPVVPTVRHHHERWDGLGYPDGLKGENIPLTARILSVADAFDTLRGARPYRAAMSRDKARKIIQAEAGTRFDPAIVSLLIRNLVSLETEIVSGGLAYEADIVGSHFVQQIKSANREVFSLYELAREFSSAADLPATLELFSAKVHEFVPFDTCAVYLLDTTKTTAAIAHVDGVNAGLMDRHAVKVGEGATGFALRTGEKVLNVEPELDFLYSEIELSRPYTAIASVPLIAGTETIGAVTIYSCHLAEYGEEHIRLLETIARIAADAIDKSVDHAEAQTNAMTDPMTGLPNARSLQVQFDKEVARAERNDKGFQLLMLDLDGFKAVNDNFGHKTGDQLLRAVSKVLAEQLRDYDFLARYGGDEFVAIIPETKRKDVADLCKRIETAVEHFELPCGDGECARVGISPGSATYQRGLSFDQMIVAADKAMYVRKQYRKRMRAAELASAAAAAALLPDPDEPSIEHFIVELDESAVVSHAVN